MKVIVIRTIESDEARDLMNSMYYQELFKYKKVLHGSSGNRKYIKTEDETLEFVLEN